MTESTRTGFAEPEPGPVPLGARISPLAVLPVFLPLAGRKVVIAGSDDAAAWKCELLIAAGARLEIYAPAPGDELRRVLRNSGTESFRLRERPWTPDVLRGAVIAIAACATLGEAEAFRCAARSHGVLANLVDRPDLCDFQFGSIVDRSPLVVGISTAGAAPVLGQEIRVRIEAVLAPGLRHWARAAALWREDVQRRGWGLRTRRRFWQAFARRALSEPHVLPDDGARRALVDETLAGLDEDRFGRVTFVRPASPRDRAIEALGSAQDVFIDAAFTGDLVGHARREAARHVCADFGDATVVRIVECAARGRDVVVLLESPSLAEDLARRCSRPGIRVTIA